MVIDGYASTATRTMSLSYQWIPAPDVFRWPNLRGGSFDVADRRKGGDA